MLLCFKVVSPAFFCVSFVFFTPARRSRFVCVCFLRRQFLLLHIHDPRENDRTTQKGTGLCVRTCVRRLAHSPFRNLPNYQINLTYVRVRFLRPPPSPSLKHCPLPFSFFSPLLSLPVILMGTHITCTACMLPV